MEGGKTETETEIKINFFEGGWGGGAQYLPWWNRMGWIQ
jgi:hypothetical protein